MGELKSNNFINVPLIQAEATSSFSYPALSNWKTNWPHRVDIVSRFVSFLFFYRQRELDRRTVTMKKKGNPSIWVWVTWVYTFATSLCVRWTNNSWITYKIKHPSMTGVSGNGTFTAAVILCAMYHWIKQLEWKWPSWLWNNWISCSEF